MRKMYSKEQPVKAGRFLTRQCFIREGKKALFLILCVFVSSYSFAQDAFTVTWPLTADGSATKAGAGATDVTGNNVYIGSVYKTHIFEAGGLILAEGEVGNGPWWLGRGGSTNPNANFTGPGTETDMYVEFTIQAGSDKDLKIDHISIPLSRPEGEGQLYYNIAYSLNGFTTTPIYIKGADGNIATPKSTQSTISSLDYTDEIIVPKGKSLAVRFMIWRRNAQGVGNVEGTSSRTAVGVGKDVFISGVCVPVPQNIFTVTWPLVADAIPTKAGDGATGVTANDVYVGSTYKNKEFNNGLIIAEGESPATVEVGYWVGRGGSGSYPNANFTGPSVASGYEAYATTDMYVEFSVQAAADRELKINQINIPLGRVYSGASPGGLHCSMAYSLDGFSGNEGSVTYILGTSSSAPTAIEAEGVFNYDQEIIVPRGKSLAVRFIVWRRNSANIGSASGPVRMKIGSNVTISGTSHEEPLPVSLTSFTGKGQGSSVVLNWTTASEKGNSHFDILRSADGKTFNKIDRIEGAGTSENINRYSYTDTQPLRGTAYYQLRQIDFNGNSELSNIISVENELSGKNLQAYITANGQVEVAYLSNKTSAAQLGIYDISGRKVINQLLQLQKGNNQISVPVNLINAGVYVVRLAVGETEVVAKFLK